MQKTYEMDMCSGPLFGKILLFTLPLMLSGILQLFFNAADVVVVGRFAGNEALAAVGSTGSLTNLLVNLFIGLSVGANILVARDYGAKKGMGSKPDSAHFHDCKRSRGDFAFRFGNCGGKASAFTDGHACQCD